MPRYEQTYKVRLINWRGDDGNFALLVGDYSGSGLKVDDTPNN